MTPLDDAAFLARLADTTLDPKAFNHRAHLRAAFLVLRDAATFGAALDRMSALIRGFAGAHGQADKYHETVTVAFMALVNARLAAQGGDTGGAPDWETFAAAHPDLLDGGAVAALYPAGALDALLAKRAFVLPGDATG
ncbi:MAG: hypothetical protein H6907_17075 [Hyphomicrobiales bacterium]|nr:hypothetical protein [Hyphomicrobiales bacterium]MCP5373443.1 hypothetical protein [Hyphomicrobiales bacterium]